jgi:hypothetical protein
MIYTVEPLLLDEVGGSIFFSSQFLLILKNNLNIVLSIIKLFNIIIILLINNNKKVNILNFTIIIIKFAIVYKLFLIKELNE